MTTKSAFSVRNRTAENRLFSSSDSISPSLRPLRAVPEQTYKSRHFAKYRALRGFPTFLATKRARTCKSRNKISAPGLNALQCWRKGDSLAEFILHVSTVQT